MISKYFKMFLVAGSSIILLGSCSKNGPEPLPPATPNYSPQTANSTWTYKNNPGSNFTITATNRDTVAQGKTYRVFLNSAGANIYMGQSGGDYYRFGVIEQLGLSGVEELYLKDGEAVNAFWTSTQNVIVPNFGTVPITLKYTIKGRSETRVVGTKTFTNVIHVRLDLSVPVPIALGGGDFYYAEGVGLIENAINVSVPGQPAINQTQVITDYSIK